MSTMFLENRFGQGLDTISVLFVSTMQILISHLVRLKVRVPVLDFRSEFGVGSGADASARCSSF